MAEVQTLLSTGLPELDNVIQNVMPGDNIVWQVDNIEDYILFVHPYCTETYKSKKKLIYFRFAEHRWLLPEGIKCDVHELHPEKGFEIFIDEIFKVIEKNGLGAFYVFDSLSELTVDWYSDRMLGNFFRLTCPYLYDFDTVTYFALFRNYHIKQTIKKIHNTAQVIIDVYHNKDDIFIQPLKVYKRYTPEMYSLHHWKDKTFIPITKSILISEILKDIPHPWLNISSGGKDMWNRTFEKAKEYQNIKDKTSSCEYQRYFDRLLRMIVTRDERLLNLSKEYFTLSDLIDIGNHMVGTGLIGGKAVGMLLSRAIINKSSPSLREKMEPHDSFFIGSDVFYTYLIRNGCWWGRWQLRKNKDFVGTAGEVRQRLLKGTFPEDILEQFREIINYYGQSPLIVRSSSLLEDAYGNSFSGKYESVFCTNQGTPEERMEAFINAVRTVYASTMGEEALMYRSRRNLLDNDEQMALLIQRVSGSAYQSNYFPQIAGVGFSFNPYVWSKDINPKTGVIRIVFGLGTRAVDRHDDDYTRIVSLNAPKKRPEIDFEEVKKYTQRKIDVLDLRNKEMISTNLENILEKVSEKVSEINIEIFATCDRQKSRYHNKDYWVLTFDRLLLDTDFIKDISSILTSIQDAYKYPVDIEFSANFLDKDHYKINLLQCRPFQVKREIVLVDDPGDIKKEKIVFKAHGPIIGTSAQIPIDQIIYVKSEVYGTLPMADRYSVARLIGKLNYQGAGKNILLIGPGRWCTTSPSLGVPTKFREINNINVLCELAEMHEGLVPDVSLGTHFFNDLVEQDMLYIAIYPQQKEIIINKDLLNQTENNLAKHFPEASRWENVVTVIDPNSGKKEKNLFINANTLEQKAICYFI